MHGLVSLVLFPASLVLLWLTVPSTCLRFNNAAKRAIPDRLQLNYYKNVLKTSWLNAEEQKVKDNVEKIRSIYGDLDVSFLDDDQCYNLIREVHSSELADYVRWEKEGMYKSDVCRSAQLYAHGGYYMDNDLVPIQDIRPALPPETELVSVIERDNRSELFQAFVAVVPRHPVMQKVLNETLRHYQVSGNKHGPAIMGDSFARFHGVVQDFVPGALVHQQRGMFQHSYLLEESPDLYWYNGVKPRGDWAHNKTKSKERSELENLNCNTVVGDRRSHTAFFFSHTEHSKSCP